MRHEIVHNPAVRTFQGNTAGFTYPNTYKMIRVRSSRKNYSMPQNFVDQYRSLSEKPHNEEE